MLHLWKSTDERGNGMSEFRRERINFRIEVHGEMDIEYEVGVETPKQAFCRTYDTSYTSTIQDIVKNAHDFYFTIEPTDIGDDDTCPDCEGTGMVMHGPNEVTCGTCEGAKTYGGHTEVDRAVEIATGEGPPF
jgi:hypothetical protein